MELKINFLAIAIAVVAHFILGFLWYTPIFGKIWGKEMGYDPNMKPDPKEMMKGMLFMVIGNVLFAWVFAHNIAAWGFVPGIKEMGVAANAMMAAVFTWLGFFLPSHLGSTVWEKRSWTLFFINAGYNLAALILVSFILHLMPAA